MASKFLQQTKYHELLTEKCRVISLEEAPTNISNIWQTSRKTLKGPNKKTNIIVPEVFQLRRLNQSAKNVRDLTAGETVIGWSIATSAHEISATTRTTTS